MSSENDIKVALNSCEGHTFFRSQNQEPRSQTRWDVTFVSGCLLWVTCGGHGLAIASMFTSIETSRLLFGLLLWQRALSLGTWTSTLLWILLELCFSVWSFPLWLSRGVQSRIALLLQIITSASLQIFVNPWFSPKPEPPQTKALMHVSPQLVKYSGQQIYLHNDEQISLTNTPHFIPSKSFSGVSAVDQSLNGPVPLAVMAATWKLYWLPFSRPVGTQTETVVVLLFIKSKVDICTHSFLLLLFAVLQGDTVHVPSQGDSCMT